MFHFDKDSKPGSNAADHSSFKVMSVFGTRPEIIKFAPVLSELESRPIFATVNVCTSQHADLAAPFLDQFGLRVDYDLKAMRDQQPLNLLLSRILAKLDGILCEEQPDFVLVQGDTTSALAGAMAAFHRRIAVGHIEAGLRSGDLRSPFPEEMNRVFIDQAASVFFAATDKNKSNLLNSGILAERIHVTGNPVVDALQAVLKQKRERSVVDDLIAGINGMKPIVITAHRRENFEGRIIEYFKVLVDFLEKKPDTCLIFPVHPNPRVQHLTDQILRGVERVHLIDPLPYPDFIKLLSYAWIIVSDSGGIQEEAPTLGVPLLIIRENTERPEVVDCGAARLIGEDPSVLSDQLLKVYEDHSWREKVSALENPFGDGRSSRRIADGIISYFEGETGKRNQT